ncbi:MAG: peptidoglycan synthetase [Flavobacteriia bacterium]|nr:MAG: peptidoglycan synthetase [Flavobacteriia bacterium]
MNIHFIAIGGAAMHNLALALHDKGYTITGSDDTIHEPSKSRLAQAGLLPETFGWFPDKIHKDLDAIVLGMHAKSDNPELQKAQALGLKIYSYPEFLYEQSKDKTRVVIGGSHGKTTITTMILHVMNYWDIPVDYMVGAQLDGFDRMVHLTADNEFIVLEGDEYLSSALDRRPKFHLYHPNIALISGIAWDHINVFPTFDSYLEQFKLFIDQIEPGGMLVYNETDDNVKRLAEQSNNTIKRYPYAGLPHSLNNGQTMLHTDEGNIALQVFGEHNLQNMAGARWVCQLMGVQEHEFYEAISSFKGAGKRLELVYQSEESVVYKDFAHAPSKVLATVNAVNNQYADKTLIACLELHTYSSLTPEFLEHYRNTLEKADIAMVFYSPDAVKIKGLEPLSTQQIKEAFNREDLQIFTDPAVFQEHLFKQSFDQSVLLLMSSGNYGGLRMETLIEQIKH